MALTSMKSIVHAAIESSHALTAVTSIRSFYVLDNVNPVCVRVYFQRPSEEPLINKKGWCHVFPMIAASVYIVFALSTDRLFQHQSGRQKNQWTAAFGRVSFAIKA